jgi:PRTRC genetic system protein C
MSIEESELERVFMFNGREITDPDPEMSAKKVMELLSKQYPSLTNGEIAGPFYDGDKQSWKLEGKKGYALSGNYGTKG